MQTRHADAAGLRLLEREAELGVVDEMLESVHGRAGRLVVIEGEPGIGKSSLVGYAIAAAARHGVRALRARGSELERNYPYGVVIALFEPLLRGGAISSRDLLGGAAAPAASLLRRDANGAPPVDPFTAIHALHWLTLNAADLCPILIAVDDAEWADEPSLSFLHYLAQRINEVPVGLVLALGPTPIAAAQGGAGDLLRTHPGAVHVRPTHLSEQAVGVLLATDGEGVDVGLRHACWEATHGNPFFVTELLREHARGDLANAIARGQRIEALIPQRVTRSVQARLARLGPETRALAEAVAILADEANLSRAARLARIGDEAAALAARALADAGVLSRSNALSFVHPIVRRAVVTSIPRPALERARRDAALLLADDGAVPEAAAAQLLGAERGGHPRVVELLVDAARSATARAEPRMAAAYLRRALDEPPPSERRSEILVELARLEAGIGAPQAIERYRTALSAVPDHDRRTRAELLLELGHTLINTAQWSAAAEAFKRALDAIGDRHDVLAARIQAGFVSATWLDRSHRDEAERLLARILESPNLGPAQRELATWIAFNTAAEASGRATDAVDLVRRALAEGQVDEMITAGQAIELAAGVLLRAGELPEEIGLLTRAIEAVQRSGWFAKLGVYSTSRAWPYYYSGRLTDAIADAQAALRASELGWEAFVPAATAILALASIERSDLAGAAAALSIDSARWSQRLDYQLYVPLARGRLHLVRGAVAEAAAEFAAAGQAAAAAGVRAPAVPDWRPWAAVSLARIGERDEARRLTREGLEVARGWGAGWPIGRALAAAGLVEGGSEGVAMLREAVTILEPSAARLEHIRALVELGATLRRQGALKDAREALMRAMHLAHRHGALALLERSREELLAAGSRPRRYSLTGVDALTPAELRVARLAAEGASNREIAQALFVTPKAVEYHLGNAFRKLGIRSRHDLAKALAPQNGKPGTVA